MNSNSVPRQELEKQKFYIEKLPKILTERFGNNPRYFVHTYGCQQNVADSERMKGLLEACGMTECENSESADFILFNTCAIRAHAEDRVFGNLGALKNNKRRKPELLIGICGCMPQQTAVSEKIKKSFPFVDIVFGTHQGYRLPEMIYNAVVSGRVFQTDENELDIAEGNPIKRDGTLKGWLPIMYGCDNFCTYCIVPFVRGRERSRHPDDIIREAESMVKAGFKEITLLGQNVNSYGKKPNYGVNFAELLKRINAIEGDFRIRFMTSHPKDCTEELLYAMRDCEKVCHHLHLPCQSGSDRVLEMMNRRYTYDGYMSLINKAKEIMPDITLTSDIIVGFPGETYQDFLCTLKLVNEVRYNALFTFIFSPRKGTKAAEMEDPVSREEKGKWFQELLSVQDKIAKENSKNYLGKTFKVICDEESEKEGIMLGHTDGNAVVEFEGSREFLGKFVNIEVTEYNGTLIGKIV